MFSTNTSLQHRKFMIKYICWLLFKIVISLQNNHYGFYRHTEKIILISGTSRRLSENFTEVVSRYHFINVIDGYALVPHIKDFFGDPDERKLHPNNEGFLRYAFALTKHIDFENILRQNI